MIRSGHHPKLVVVAGMPRSGSTWVFNVCRLLLEQSPEPVQAVWVDDYDPAFPAALSLVKVHAPDEALRDAASTVVSSRRDLRDIAASAVSMGWAKTQAEQLAAATEARRLHEYWAPHAAADIAFETIQERPATAVQTLGDAVSMPLSRDAAEAILARLPQRATQVGPGGYDPKTLLHLNHVTDGRSGRWRDQLDGAVADAIAAAHAPWLHRHGYGVAA